tara:strand:- start:301 stop:450 length:150 start_codon:yes stop_codon:yes gene_type:complete
MAKLLNEGWQKTNKNGAINLIIKIFNFIKYMNLEDIAWKSFYVVKNSFF